MKIKFCFLGILILVLQSLAIDLNDIEEKYLMCVHVTDIFPRIDEEGFLTITPGNTTPVEGRVGSTLYQGVTPQTRLTTHWTLNHHVESHDDGDWSARLFGIIIPYQQMKTQFVGGDIKDLYTFGPLPVPEGSILVMPTSISIKGIHPSYTIERYDSNELSLKEAVEKIFESQGYPFIIPPSLREELPEKYDSDKLEGRITWSNGVSESLTHTNSDYFPSKSGTDSFQPALHGSSVFCFLEYLSSLFGFDAFFALSFQQKLTEATYQQFLAEVGDYDTDIDSYFSLQDSLLEHYNACDATRALVKERKKRLRELWQIWQAERAAWKEDKSLLLNPEAFEILNTPSDDLPTLLTTLKNSAVTFTPNYLKKSPSEEEVHEIGWCDQGLEYKVLFKAHSITVGGEQISVPMTFADALLERLAPLYSETVFPKPFTDAIRNLLRKSGKDPDACLKINMVDTENSES